PTATPDLLPLSLHDALPILPQSRRSQQLREGLSSDRGRTYCVAMSRTLTVHPVPGLGAEDVVVGRSGRDQGAVFTGTSDGSIFRDRKSTRLNSSHVKISYAV